MRTILLSLLVSCSRPNRACIIAENALELMHEEGSCVSISLGETVDQAKWFFDGGERMCHDLLVPHHTADGEVWLDCMTLKPSKSQTAAAEKAKAETEAKTKLEADAKAKVEAEAKARADLEAKSHVDAGADAK